MVAKYEGTLRCIYTAYSRLGHSGRNDISKFQSTANINLFEWLQFASHVGLFDLGLINITVAQQAFSSSRIRCVADYSAAQEIRIRTLTFEDFLEAVIRLATVIALPTDEEIDKVKRRTLETLCLHFEPRKRWSSVISSRSARRRGSVTHTSLSTSAFATLCA